MIGGVKPGAANMNQALEIKPCSNVTMEIDERTQTGIISTEQPNGDLSVICYACNGADLATK
jgi:hypothetical protein